MTECVSSIKLFKILADQVNTLFLFRILSAGIFMSPFSVSLFPWYLLPVAECSSKILEGQAATPGGGG